MFLIQNLYAKLTTYTNFKLAVFPIRETNFYTECKHAGIKFSSTSKICLLNYSKCSALEVVTSSRKYLELMFCIVNASSFNKQIYTTV